VPLDGSNLVLRALALYRARTGSRQRFRAALTKRCPSGAGLGGGSANASTALWGAARLCERLAGDRAPAVADADLMAWSADVGSDCPVFFSGTGAAYVTGRGERVEDVAPPLPLSTPLLLVKPPVGLSTPQIFRALDLGRRSTADGRDLLARLAAAAPPPGGGGGGGSPRTSRRPPSTIWSSPPSTRSPSWPS